MTAVASKVNAYVITGIPIDKIGASKVNAYVIAGTVETAINASKVNAYLISDATPPPAIRRGNMFMLF